LDVSAQRCNVEPEPKATAEFTKTINLGPLNPPTFDPYKRLFEAFADKYKTIIFADDVNFRFGDILCPKSQSASKHCAVAYCEYSTNTIVVDRTDWKSYKYYNREQAIFHEMGHCLLKRDHRNDLDSTCHPVSGMYWRMIDEQWYKDNREKYMEELFDKADESFDDNYVRRKY
jgi:hypothetical protein